MRGAGTTVAQVRESFRDEHVRAVLIADQGILLTVVERADLAIDCPDTPAREFGTPAGRMVGPEADLEQTWRAMEAASRRRLAVVAPGNLPLGLLCLKRTGRGICTDADVEARAAEPT